MADKKRVISFILGIAVQILNFIISCIGGSERGKKGASSDPKDIKGATYKQDTRENKKTKSKIADFIKEHTVKKSLGGVFLAAAAVFVGGCISLNFGDGKGEETGNETILVANSNNVYRLAADTVLRVKVQRDDGKWCESKHRVLISEDWFLVSPDAIETE